MNENISEEQADDILNNTKIHKATGVITAYNKKTELVSLCFNVPGENPIHIAISLQLCSEIHGSLEEYI